MQGCKTLMGVVEGNSVPDIVVPELLDLYMQRQVSQRLSGEHYDFDQINQAAADAAFGAAIKPILRISRTTQRLLPWLGKAPRTHSFSRESSTPICR